MSTTFYITAKGFVYAGLRRGVNVNAVIPLFSRLLNAKSKAATFDALSQGINVKWDLQDEIVNPFGDKRQALVTVYTFDLDNDILLFSDETQTLQLSLYRFREDRSVALDEFTVFEQPSLVKSEYTTFPCTFWNPSFPLPFRSRPFVTRILSDFAHQWRHILRHPYTDSTFRKLARAILCIATLDFKVVEKTSRWMHTTEHGPYVWIHYLPFWQPYEEHFFRLGNITIVLDQDLEQAIAQIRKNITEKKREK